LETALTMALFFGFIFLIIDISMAVFIKGSLQTAVEAGVRTGVTETLLPGTSYLTDSIAQTVAQNSKGYVSTTKPTCSVTVQYYDPDGSPPGYVTALASGHNTVLIVSVNGYRYSAMGPILQGWGYNGRGYTAPMPLNIAATATGAVQPCTNGQCPPATNPSPPSCP
jgi:Flp pilus assembly protein TadG